MKMLLNILSTSEIWIHQSAISDSPTPEEEGRREEGWNQGKMEMELPIYMNYEHLTRDEYQRS